MGVGVCFLEGDVCKKCGKHKQPIAEATAFLNGLPSKYQGEIL